MSKADELIITAKNLKQAYDQGDTTPLGFRDIEVAYECVVKCLKAELKDITDTVHG